jgi:hypothetical protein
MRDVIALSRFCRAARSPAGELLNKIRRIFNLGFDYPETIQVIICSWRMPFPDIFCWASPRAVSPRVNLIEKIYNEYNGLNAKYENCLLTA